MLPHGITNDSNQADTILNHKPFSSFFLLALLLLSSFGAKAQVVRSDSLKQARQHYVDSVQAARAHYTDSLRAARKHLIDSMNTARQNRLDSLRTAQQRRNDSLKAIRDYRNSNHYKDSVTAVRQHRRDSIMTIRQHIVDSTKEARLRYTDSLRMARKHTLDSMKQARQHYADSLHAYFDSVRVARAKELEKLKAERERRSDSLAAIRAYRKSAAYKDSLTAIRQHRRDSLIAIRKHYTDSVRSAQKAYTDSIVTVRKAYNDSLRTSLDSIRQERQRVIDSMVAVRKATADSLATVRAAKKAEREKNKEEREKKKALALEIKFQKKQDAYSNKQMLKKKWGLPRRVMQNTFTRYNYYYNADLLMEQAEENMRRSHDDNYDSLLTLFPFDPNVDSAKLSSDMDSIIKRASVGIQIHDPRSKWQDDLYLLVGQAYYYKADYQNAGAAFKQIIVTDEKQRKRKRNKKKASEDNKQPSFSVQRKKGIAGLLQHVPAKNEAMLWLARTFVQSGEEGQAQTLLDLLKNDANFPDKMKGRLALEQAFINLNNRNAVGASEALAIVARDKNMPQWQRQRAGYIAGQLYEESGELDTSNYYFHEVIALHPPIKMDFYAKKNIAFNQLKGAVAGGQSIQLLESLAKDGKYKPFYDQIYYGIAMAKQKEGRHEEAMQDFRKSLSFGKNNPKQMGLTYTQIGDAYYQRRAYVPAKGAYDSAAALLASFSDQTEYNRSLLRSTALTQIASPAATVTHLDSLLHLASLPEKEQYNIIRQYIKALEKARRDSLFLAENSHQANAGGNLFSSPPSAQSWYFSTPARVSSGKIAFKQKWGDRKLADNWRLGNNTFAANSEGGGDAQTSSEAEDVNNSGIPDEETLFAAIPHTDSALNASRDTLRESLFRLGKGYYTYLEDFENAIHTFDTLDKRFPENPHQAEVLYLRHLIAMRTNEPERAKDYLQTLTRKFPESEWARLLTAAARESQSDTTQSGQGSPIDDYYNKTYDLLKAQQYEAVLERSRNYAAKFPAPGDYVDKFTLLEATAYAGLSRYSTADSILNGFIKQHPDGALSGWAKDILNYIHGMQRLTDTAAKPSSADTLTKRQPAAFAYNPSEAHLLIIAAPADMRIFTLKSNLRDFNLTHAGSENISISMTTLNPENNLIVCQTFKGEEEAKAYLADLTKEQKLFKDYTGQEYHVLLISQGNYSKLIQQRSLKKYLTFYKKHY